MQSFSAKIFIIGVNPYVLIPRVVLAEIFRQAGKNKGPVPIRGTLNGKKFTQTLVKYSGKWRLYLNTPMRKAAGIDVGDMAKLNVEYDPEPRSMIMHEKLKQALEQNQTAGTVFEKLPASRQKEIMRYISFLKTDISVKRNVDKVIRHLLGKELFAGRDLKNRALKK